MRKPFARPSGSTLPLPPARSQHRRHRIDDHELDGREVARFNDVLHTLNPDAPHLDADAIVSVARWLTALPEPQAKALLQARLARLSELEMLLADPDWQIDAAMARRIKILLAYVNTANDLIPDNRACIGKLDDALLVELAWPAIADELEDFLDFSRFREESGHLYFNHPERDDWLRTRLEEGALWEQLRCVREHHYAECSPISQPFRVM